MDSCIEHMLTNICLWFSSKPCGDFILQSPVPQETRLIKFNSYDYDTARQKLIKYLCSLGEIDDIYYNHADDRYDIYILQGELGHYHVRLYSLNYVPNCIIEI